MKRIKKWFIMLTIITGVSIIDLKKYEYKTPELVSTINSMNREYCSIILHKKHVSDKVELAVVLIDLCKENAFDNIKFATDVRGYPSSLSLNVYLTKKDFENGKQYMNVRYEMINYSKTGDIRDEITNYQLYIDNELIEMADF